MFDQLKIWVSLLVLAGFAGVFGWAFYATWTQSSDINQAQKRAADMERDRIDAVRRFEEAKRDASAAKEDKDVHERNVKTLGEKLEELTKRAADANAAAVAALSIFSDNRNYLATALAGLIGTVVATMFGKDLGETKAAVPTATPAAQTLTAAAHLVRDLNGWRKKLSSAYAITYFLFGAVAIGTWAFAPYCPDMIKSLATISLTLILAITRSFFN